MLRFARSISRNSIVLYANHEINLVNAKEPSFDREKQIGVGFEDKFKTKAAKENYSFKE